MEDSVNRRGDGDVVSVILERDGFVAEEPLMVDALAGGAIHFDESGSTEGSSAIGGNCAAICSSADLAKVKVFLLKRH